jgi:hypothetical protein
LTFFEVWEEKGKGIKGGYKGIEVGVVLLLSRPSAWVGRGNEQ